MSICALARLNGFQAWKGEVEKCGAGGGVIGEGTTYEKVKREVVEEIKRLIRGMKGRV